MSQHTPKEFGHVIGYANHLNLKISVIDLETIGFRSANSPRGIIEFAGFTVIPGQEAGVEYATLLDPENNIPSQVVKLTHISNDMVKGRRKYDENLASIVNQMAEEHLVVGFNHKGFDCRYLIDMHLLKGFKAPTFSRILDVKTAANGLLSFDKDESSSLTAVARKLGLSVDESTLHRAGADVKLTVEVFDEMLKRFGTQLSRFVVDLDGNQVYAKTMAERSRKEEKGEAVKLSQQDIFEYVQSGQYEGFLQAASDLKTDTATLEKVLSDFLDKNQLDAGLFAEPEVERIFEGIEKLNSSVLSCGKLKPVREEINDKLGFMPSYLSVRIFLLTAGYDWNMRQKAAA